MHIICWNLQTNSARTIDASVARQIALELDSIVREPFIFFILESKADPGTVASAIANALADRAKRRLSYGHEHIGGSSSRRENIIWICSPDVEIESVESVTTWGTTFEMALQRHNDELRSLKLAYSLMARDLHSLRNEPAELTFKEIEATDLRNPLLAKLKCGTEKLSVAVVHSPGPQDKSEVKAVPFASLYFKAIMGTLLGMGVEVVIGDFNLYQSTDINGFKDVSGATGATTYGTGRLDRAFVKIGYDAQASLLGPGVKPDYTDHRAIALSGVKPTPLPQPLPQATSSAPLFASSAMQGVTPMDLGPN